MCFLSKVSSRKKQGNQTKQQENQTEQQEIQTEQQESQTEQQGISEATFTENENFSFVQEYVPEREEQISRPVLGSFRSPNALLQCFPHLVHLGSVLKNPCHWT